MPSNHSAAPCAELLRHRPTEAAELVDGFVATSAGRCADAVVVVRFPPGHSASLPTNAAPEADTESGA